MLSKKIFHSKGQGVPPNVSRSIRMQRLFSGSCVIVWTAIVAFRWQRQYADLMSIFLQQYVFPWELPSCFDDPAEQSCQAPSIHALLKFFFYYASIHQ